jgi:hypothetical protein
LTIKRGAISSWNGAFLSPFFLHFINEHSDNAAPSRAFSDKSSILSVEFPDNAERKGKIFLRNFIQNLAHFQLHFQELFIDFHKVGTVKMLYGLDVPLELLRQGVDDHWLHAVPHRYLI